MKFNRLFIVFILAGAMSASAAKDSTFLFKFSAGASFSFLEARNLDDFSSLYPKGKYSQESQNKGVSPFAKFSVQKSFAKWLSADLSLSYCYGKILHENFAYSGRVNETPAPTGFAHQSVIRNNYTIYCHQLMLSAGPNIKLAKFYVSPQVNFNYFLIQFNDDRMTALEEYTYHYTSIGKTSEVITRDSYYWTEKDFRLGFGMSMGYWFKIKNRQSFIEVGGNYHDTRSGKVKPIYNAFLSLGIAI